MSLRATPPALATETQPSTASQSQSWLGNQFWPRPQRERGGEELPHLLAFPWLASGGTRPLPKGSRCPRRRQAARRGILSRCAQRDSGYLQACLLDGYLGRSLCLLGSLGSYPGSIRSSRSIWTFLPLHSPGLLAPLSFVSAPFLLCIFYPPLHPPVPSILPSVTSSSAGSPVSL